MNIASRTLKKMVAQWVRAWLPFTVVTKGGWLGFSDVQPACDFTGARGGGMVFIGPGTWYEAVDVRDDYVTLFGCGPGVTIIASTGAAGPGVMLTGDYSSAWNMQINSESGGGQAAGNSHACQAIGDYTMFFRILNTESDNAGFGTASTAIGEIISHCIVPADDHDSYASNLACPQSIIIANKFVSGGGYNSALENTADQSLMVGNICDGVGATIYGVVIGTACENCIVSGNWVGNMLATDIWERSGTSLVLVPDGGGPLNETV